MTDLSIRYDRPNNWHSTTYNTPVEAAFNSGCLPASEALTAPRLMQIPQLTSTVDNFCSRAIGNLDSRLRVLIYSTGCLRGAAFDQYPVRTVAPIERVVNTLPGETNAGCSCG
ncbi:hypothetical protein PILCRDRAFT_824584 [Piloderma croceum F 1598]|uniref:Uncharacterized protein n=1 Tax=Piloderma croceum (strain F 1598) TaxID=765440 RepID=A0A0C3BM25_PILCF|nr:hypothetical protein PILCRDRAFT_824584 [Piloderma croceum F 1598]